MTTRIKTTLIVFSIAAAVFAARQRTTEAKDAGGKVATQPKVSRATNKTKAAAPDKAVPAGVTLNACGCYRTDAGACFCGDKNGACSCPGDCEPMACEQKRAKEIQREVAAETKRAQDEEKRHQDEAAATAAAAAAAATAKNTENAPVSSGDSVVGETDEAAVAEKKADEPKPEKPAAKPRKRAAARP